MGSVPKRRAWLWTRAGQDSSGTVSQQEGAGRRWGPEPRAALLCGVNQLTAWIRKGLRTAEDAAGVGSLLSWITLLRISLWIRQIEISLAGAGMGVGRQYKEWSDVI